MASVPAAQSRIDEGGALAGGVKPVLSRHNGISLILPHFEQGATFAQIDFDWDWDHSRNEDYTKQNLGGILLCPSAPENRERYHATDYVAATHAEKQRKELTLTLPEFKGRSFRLLHDKADGSAGLTNITVGDNGVVALTLEPGGGAVLFP